MISHPFACSGLSMTGSGEPTLGETLTFTLSNVGTDIPGFAFGIPTPPSFLLCASCALGVSPTGVVLVLGNALSVPIAPTLSLVGFHGAVQALTLGSGPCIAQLRFSDSYEFTVR